MPILLLQPLILQTTLPNGPDMTATTARCPPNRFDGPSFASTSRVTEATGESRTLHRTKWWTNCTTTLSDSVGFLGCTGKFPCPSPHLTFWVSCILTHARGVWALIQSQISQIDFDYASYAEHRFGEYTSWRREQDGSRVQAGEEMPLRERRWAEE